MQIPGLDIAKRQVKNTIDDALFPTQVRTAVETVQDWQLKKVDKQKENARKVGKTVSPKELKNAAETVKDILTPGFAWWNPLKWVSTSWYAVIDFLPGNNSTNKILSDNLETFREPNQSPNFQTDAMDIFREHLNFLDIAMKRMGDKPPIFKFLPFLKKQDAEHQRIKAEKTKYINEVISSLDTHLSYIQENMVPNTVQRTYHRRDSMGNYQAEIKKRDINDLEKFAANIAENGKYGRLSYLPAMQSIKEKVDKMVGELDPNSNAARETNSNRARGNQLAAPR